jgi:hypothetical protein
MKTSAFVLAASATLAMAEPKFLNTNFDVVPGEPFTLKFSGCSAGCSIILLNGDSKDLKDVQTLVKDVKGSEETITLSDKFTKDVYAFRIVDSAGEENYSEQFTFDGADAPATTAEETSTVAETTSSAEETSTEEETSTSAAETTTSAEETTTTEASTMTTPEASTTESETSTTTSDSDDSEQTDDNSDSAPDDDGAAVRLGSSHAALAAAVVALAGYVL